MRHKNKSLLLILLLFALSLPVGATPPLRLGVFPYISAEQLVQLYQPLRDYLQTETGQPIRLLSAPDFRQFIQRTGDGRYDIVITAPHLGRRAQQQHGYHWIGFTGNRSTAVFVAPRNGPVQQLRDLAGRRLALPPRVAIVHQLALEKLESLDLGSRVTPVTFPSHDRALYALLHAKTDAAAIGRPTWLRYAAPDKDSLRVIGEGEEIPGFAVLFNARMPPELGARLREAFYRFGQSPAGKKWFESTGLQDIRPPRKTELQRLDHYLGRIDAARGQRP